MDYDTIKNWRFDDVHHRYDEKDTMLYALGIGLGHDPLDAGQLRYVYEQGLRAFPTLATVLGYPAFWMSDPRAGIDWVRLVHGEQRLAPHAPLPPRGPRPATTRTPTGTAKHPPKGPSSTNTPPP